MPEFEPSKVQMVDTIMYVSTVTPTGSYHLARLVGTVDVSFLLHTGAAVTLLWEDTWLQVAAKNRQALRPWLTVKLVSASRAPLTIHGCVSVELELESEKFQLKLWWSAH